MATFTLDNTGIGPAGATPLTIPNNTTSTVVFVNDTDARLQGFLGLGAGLTIGGTADRVPLDIPANDYVVMSVVSTATTGTVTLGFNSTDDRLETPHRTSAHVGETVYFGLV